MRRGVRQRKRKRREARSPLPENADARSEETNNEAPVPELDRNTKQRLPEIKIGFLTGTCHRAVDLTGITDLRAAHVSVRVQALSSRVTFSNFRAPPPPRLQPSKADKAGPLSEKSRDRLIRTSTASRGQRPKETIQLHFAVSGLSRGLSRCCYHRANTFSKPFSNPIFKTSTILATGVWAHTCTQTLLSFLTDSRSLSLFLLISSGRGGPLKPLSLSLLFSLVSSLLSSRLVSSLLVSSLSSLLFSSLLSSCLISYLRSSPLFSSPGHEGLAP